MLILLGYQIFHRFCWSGLNFSSNLTLLSDDCCCQKKYLYMYIYILKAHQQCTTKRDIFCLRVRNKQWILNTDIVKESIPQPNLAHVALCNIMKRYNLSRQASTTLSLDFCPDFMGNMVGQASFLFHISTQFLPHLEGISVKKSKLRGGMYHFYN